MARKCKHLGSMSRYALLLMVIAGTGTFAEANESVKSKNDGIREVVNTESKVRNAMLNDIDMQWQNLKAQFKKADLTEKELQKLSEDCDALLAQLKRMPGFAAEEKYAKIKDFREDIRSAYVNFILNVGGKLFEVGKYDLAKVKYGEINNIDKVNGAKISAPYIEKCDKKEKTLEYKNKIDIKKFDSDYTSDIQEIDVLMRKAQTYYNNGKYQEVINVLENVYLIDPFNVRATTLLDKAYGKIYSMAKSRHRVTTQEMLAQDEWIWIMPVKNVNSTKNNAERDPEVKFARNAVEAKMDKIIFPKFEAPGLDITSILKDLAKRSKAYDDDGVGISIIPQFEPKELNNKKFKKIHMRFSTIPLSEILRYLSLNLGIKYKVNQQGEIVVGVSVDDMAPARYFSVRDELAQDILNSGDANVSSDAGDEEAGGDGDGNAAAATAKTSSADEQKMKAYFEARGVEFPPRSSIRYNRKTHKLIVINSEENLRKFDDLLRQIQAIDVPMVMTEVKFIEISETDFNQLGFDWNFSLSDSGRSNGLWNLSAGTNFVSQLDANNKPSAFIQNLNLLPNFDSDWGGLKPSLNVTVHALSQNDRVEVLTAPRLISRNGMEASIKMVTETRYPDSWEAPEVETESDNVTSVSFPVPELGDPKPVGVTLKVTPNVNGNVITLDLHPEIISFLGSGNSSYPVSVQQGIRSATGDLVPTMLNEVFNVWMPEMGIRRIDAKVKVEDGETIVLGGVINNTIERREEKMPLLGSIPLLGRLFQNRTEESSKKNLLIFVTARLINSDGRLVNQATDNGTPHFNF